MSQKKAFSKKTKQAVAVFTETETDGMHYDHIVPQSKGGESTVDNCQLLPAKANLQKSNHHVELREWQEKFLTRWRSHGSAPFLCVAIPGGGKTVAALMAAREFLIEDPQRRLMIVVPSVNLREQWRAVAARLGIQIQTKDFASNFKTGFKGGAVTYQSLDTQASLLRLMTRSNTMVIMDEPHHCSEDDGRWGVSAKHAFENAARMLLLSGTPFRTDGRPIPFVNYDADGFCIPHFRYDYPDALMDGVVRQLSFDYSSGQYELLQKDDDGEDKSVIYDLNGDMTASASRGRLSKLLRTDGDFVRALIGIAHSKLVNVRRVLPDAAGLVVCMNSDHCLKTAKVIEEVTGRRPEVVLCDSDKATTTVDAFRKSHDPWLVSVRQVSEGTDIPRLHVLCYMTNWRSEMFFRQLIGRVSRVRFREGEQNAPEDHVMADCEAYVVLPADPVLVSHAKNLIDMQIKALREKGPGGGEGPGAEATEFVFMGSDHKGMDRIVIGNRHYFKEDADKIMGIAQRGGITESKAAEVLEYIRSVEGGTRIPHATTQPPQADIPLEERLNKIRRDVARSVSALSFVTGIEHRDIHKTSNEIVGCRQSEMSLEQVTAKAKLINHWRLNPDEYGRKPACLR